MKAAFVYNQGNVLMPKVARPLTRFQRGHGGRAPWLHTGAASLRQSQRRLLVTQSKPVAPTRKRKRFIGANRGDALVGVPAGVDYVVLALRQEACPHGQGPGGLGRAHGDDEELAAKAP